MFKPQNKIIIVDNNSDHLADLSKPFHDNGIGCRAFKYDANYNEPLEDVRIAFFDINLNDLNPTGNESQIFAVLADAIKLYIKKGNGPFALIFWTSNPVLINQFKAYITEREPEVPFPFLVTHIDKNEFLGTGPNLGEKIRELLGDEIIELLFDFESKALDSACKTINQLYDIIPKADTWGDNSVFKSNFEIVFSKIAASTLGINYAKTNPDKAVYEALLPTLNYQFNNTMIDKKWEKQLTTLKKARRISDIIAPAGFSESILNGVFHIDSKEIDFPLDTRGAVIELDKDSEKFNQSFNVKFDTWFNTFLPISESKLRKQVRNASLLIAIELSSACDYSNQKQRLNKYLMGVITPCIDASLDFGKVKLPDCSFYIGEFSIKKDHFQIWANLNYVFGTIPSDTRFIKPHFILKKEIMDMIGNRYANHVSRIGITSF